jgi:UDP-N-acetylmuramoylalanine--D-glutamate ligase
LELSSFQLEHIHSFLPAIAGLLNISEDHMDRYKDIHDYSSIKIKLTKNMNDSGWIIYNGDDSILDNAFHKHQHTQLFSIHNHQKSYFKLNASKIYSGSLINPDVLLKFDETKLKGRHNLQNILAAATMAHAFGISSKAIRDAITNFVPIPHRLEWIGSINGVEYFNDSKATNVAAAIAAIESFDNHLIMIMGGMDKGHTDFSQLNPSLTNCIKHIFTYGQAGQSIEQQLNSTTKVTYVEKFKSAVIQASKQSKPGDIILLSPACASFDQFCNYEERGDTFKNIFNNLELGL